MNRKLQSVSIETKQKILKEIDEKRLKKSQIASKFGVAKSTISTILKNRGKIEAASEMYQFGPGRKRIRTGRNEDVEIALLRWIKNMKSQNVTLTGPILQKKAHFFAESLGVTDFMCSNGWLSRFKLRHGFVGKQICGEETTVDINSIDTFFAETWPIIANEYACCDIFIKDEMGLFFKAHPLETYNFRGEKCSGGKFSNERVTVMVVCNLDGTEKIPLLVVGKSVTPLCFNGVKTFPTEYDSSKNALMNCGIFTKWLLKLDLKFQNQKRNVCLLLNNSTAHIDIQGLEAIKCAYFPSNTNQDIIKELKMYYKKEMVLQSIECSDKQVEFSVNLLEAMCYLKKAWDTVSSASIRNSFKRSGFKHPSFVDTFEEVFKSSNDLLIGAAENRGILSASMFAEYVSMDDDILTAEIPNYADIIYKGSEQQDIAVSNQVDSDDDTDTELPSLIKLNEAAAALKTVQNFLMQQDYASCALNNLDKVDTFIKECFIDNAIKKSGTGSNTTEIIPLTKDK